MITNDRKEGRYSVRVVVVAPLHRLLWRPVRRRVDSTSTTEPAPAFVVRTLLCCDSMALGNDIHPCITRHP